MTYTQGTSIRFKTEEGFIRVRYTILDGFKVFGILFGLYTLLYLFIQLI